MSERPTLGALFQDVVSFARSASRVADLVEAMEAIVPASVEALRAGALTPEEAARLVSGRLRDVHVRGVRLSSGTIERLACGVVSLFLDLDRAGAFRREGPTMGAHP